MQLVSCRLLPNLSTPLLALLILCLSAVDAGAQGDDIRISSDPSEPVIPADAQIQDMASIGENALVVWGSTETAAGGGIRNMLYGQMVRDTVAQGSPVRVGSASAFPTGYVQVMMMEERFLVLWNDRRDGRSALYCCSVDTGGTISAENLLADMHTDGNEAILLKLPSGYRLLWNDTAAAPMIHYRDIAIDGVPQGSVGIVGPGRMVRAIRPASPSGSTLIEREGLSPLLIDADGAKRSSGIAPPGSSGGYYLGEDGEMLTIYGGTVRIYPSFYDSTPPRLLQAPSTGALAGTEMVFRDSAGRIVVMFAILEFNDYGSDKFLTLIGYSATETDSGTFSQPVEIVRLGLESGNYCFTIYHRLDRVWTQRLCGNRYSVGVDVTVRTIFDCHGHREERVHLRSVGYVVDSTGRIPESFPCTPSPSVFRLQGKRASEVVLMRYGRPLRLEAPAAVVQVNVPQRFPVFGRNGGAPAIGWISEGTDTAVHMIQWGSREEVFPPLLRNSAAEIEREGMQLKTELAVSGDRVLLTSMARWQEPDSSGQMTERERYDLLIAADSGWRTVHTVYDSSNPRTLRPLGYNWDQDNGRSLAYRHNPDDGSILAAIGLVTNTGWVYKASVFSFDSMGTVQWVADSLQMDPVPGLIAVPLGGEDFLVWHDQAGFGHYLRRQHGAAYVSGNSFRHPEAVPGYMKLRGENILRWYIRFADKGPRVDMLDTAGAILHSIELKNGPSRPDFNAANITVLQHPRESTLALLHGSSEGVKLTVLRNDLTLLSQSIVSVTTDSVGFAMGMFQGDSLLVAWEDFRNGRSDIYGRSIAWRSVAGVEKDAPVAPEGMLVTLAPNPARSFCLVRLSDPATPDMRLDVVDIYGRVIATQAVEPGTGQIRLHTGGLPAGVYLVSVGSPSRQGVPQRMVVMH